MTDRILVVADGFWNIRGSFKVAGLVDVGTHASLVRQASGKLVFLDSYTFEGEVERELRALTKDGEDVEAVLNVHPFHTVHVRRMHERFPNAKHYGTARHLSRYPELRWEALRTEDSELHQMFSDDFDFSVPRGVDFISSNQNIHFSSVLVYHRASKTIHVDDTLNYMRLPKAARVLGKSNSTSFQPTLPFALEKRAGAAHDFRQWGEELVEAWGDAENLCTAHNAALLARQNDGAPIRDRILKALDKTSRTLRRHERKYG